MLATITLLTCGSDLCLAVVPMMTASVLSGFRQSPPGPTSDGRTGNSR